MPTHTIATTWSRSGETISQSVSVTADGEINADVALTASQANKQVDVAIDVSDLKSLLISSDVNCTVYTNAASGGSPDQTIAITADKPLIWNQYSGLENPLDTDVTALYITNGAAAAGTVKIRALLDVTP